MKKYLKLMRVHHYLKNFLIYMPLIFSSNFFNWQNNIAALGGVCAFSLLSSAIYIINDINDIEKDRLHPIKKKRPIASGEVSKKTAWIVCACCLVGSVVFQSLIGNVSSILYLLLYLILNILYSKWWKNIPILDVVVLVSGFLLRVLYGGAITNIVISGWLYLTVIAAAFYMALGKRRNELKKQNSSAETRAVLAGYTYEFLDKNMHMCLGLANTFYALWAKENENSLMLWTVPMVLIISMKYSLDVEGDSQGDPVDVITQDKVLLLIVIVYIVFMFCIIYLG